MRVPREAVVAGVASGIGGLLLFLVLHALWIMPIWFVAPMGLAVAVLGGIAIGWAYAELVPRMPAALLLRAVVVTSIVVLVLAPAFVLAEMRDPLFDIVDESAVLAKPLSFAVLIFLAELLATATVMGGMIGWVIGRTRRSATAMAVAAFVFALGPGHNIPLIGGTRGISMELRIMLPVIGLTAATLVVVHHWLEGKREGPLRNAPLHPISSPRTEHDPPLSF